MGIFRQLTTDHPTVASGTKIIKADDYRTLLEADDIIQKAHTEAQRILSEAVTHYQEERQRGYQDGREESQMEAAEHMMDLVGRTVGYFSTVEQDMGRILLKALRKIINDFDDTEVILHVIRNALNTLGSQKRITLRVAPEQKETVDERIHQILTQYQGIGFVDVVADRRLGRGGCVVESEVGVIDASLETQLTALENSVERLFGEKSPTNESF